jgi:hypothetical protein
MSRLQLIDLSFFPAVLILIFPFSLLTPTALVLASSSMFVFLHLSNIS